MKVLVAGATGALGHALIPKLVSAGHAVVGLSRRAEARPEIESLGAVYARADLLALERLVEVVGGAAPDVVVHAAKAIPKRGPIFFRDMADTHRLHDEGTKNLVTAAVKAGTRQVVIESVVFVYGYGDFGDTLLTEDHPLGAHVPRRQLADGVAGVVAMERHALEAEQRGELTATVLRCGVFYGPRAGTDLMVQMLRRRMMAIPGAGRALWPLVYIQDVADAFVAAVAADAAGGVFNIVGDEPAPLRDFVDELAALAGAPRPWALPSRLGRIFAPYFTETALTSMRVSNARAKAVLGWEPRHPTYRDGLTAWARASGAGDAGSRR